MKSLNNNTYSKVTQPNKINVFEKVKLTSDGRDYLPDGMTRDDLSIYKYLVGDKVSSSNTLTLDHFHSIQFLCYSQNKNDKRIFMHALGTDERYLKINILVLIVNFKK